MKDFVSKINDHIRVRLRILGDSSCLTVWERIQIAARLNYRQQAAAAIRKRIKLENGKRYVCIGGNKIFLCDGTKKGDDEYFLSGASLVIAETFIFPDLFSGSVVLRPGDVCLDLGANIGTTGLVCSALVGACGRVIAVEPVVHEVLESNVAVNRRGNITVIKKAVADSEGAAEI